MNRRRLISIILVAVLLGVIPQSSFGYSGGITGRSSSGCTCHSGGSGEVTPSLSGLDSGYVGNQTYNLTIGGSGGPTGSEGGFNLASNFGTFSNPGTNAQILIGQVTHSNSNSRSWTVDWTAPSNGTGNVTFTLAVNFVNGNGLNTGDGWGTMSLILQEDSDGDGWTNADETACGNDPNDSSDTPEDEDGDGDKDFQLKLNDDSFSSSVPAMLRIGGSHELQPKLTLMANYDQAFSEGFGITTTPRLSGGVEYRLVEWFPVRFGLSLGGRSRGASAGFALGPFSVFHMQSSLDLAAMTRGGFFPGVARGLAISASWRLNLI